MPPPAVRRFLHSRCGHSVKVSSLNDYHYRMWTQYIMSADDFGVMRASPVVFQSDNDYFAERDRGELQEGIDRLIEVQLVQTFEHQGRWYIYQADWQTFQKIDYPRITIEPMPIPTLMAACDDATQVLFSLHPGGSQRRWSDAFRAFKALNDGTPKVPGNFPVSTPNVPGNFPVSTPKVPSNFPVSTPKVPGETAKFADADSAIVVPTSASPLALDLVDHSTPKVPGNFPVSTPEDSRILRGTYTNSSGYLHESYGDRARAPALMSTNANANANASGIGEGLEGGTVEPASSPPFDLWLQTLKAEYPVQAVTSGHMTELAFLKIFEGQPDPAAIFARMRANLDNQKRGHRWAVKQMVPNLDNWLSSGRWEQQHDERPPGTVINERNMRNLSAAQQFIERKTRD